MYARRVGDRELTFDFAEGLVDDNLLISDRETESVWSQLAGKAIFGPLENEPLRKVASIQTTWGQWQRMHPETSALIDPKGKGRPYRYRSWLPGQPKPKTPPAGHDTRRLGLGLVVEGTATFLPLSELQKGPSPTEISLGGQRIKVYHPEDGVSAWAEDAAGRLLDGVMVYDYGWERFFPASERWHAAEGSLSGGG